MNDILSNILEKHEQTRKRRNRNSFTKKKKFQPSKCHPRNFTSKNNQNSLGRSSCLNDKTLRLMKQIWNRRHPDNMIHSGNPKQLWNYFKENLGQSCSNEMCWVDNTIQDERMKTKIKHESFAPYAPRSWNKNKNEWLSSTDITDVMRQYEDAYDDFKFFGPSPIDFDAMEYKNNCVWPEICNFNVQHMRDQRKNKLGFIFNTDDHFKSGSHWIAMFVDLGKKRWFFFDSNGTKPPREITKLMIKIQKQCLQKCNMNLKLDSNHPFVHQHSNTECGMYCLYFIVSLLKNTHNMNYFKKKRIPDSYVEKFRNIYFNPSM